MGLFGAFAVAGAVVLRVVAARAAISGVAVSATAVAAGIATDWLAGARRRLRTRKITRPCGAALALHDQSPLEVMRLRRQTEPTRTVTTKPRRMRSPTPWT